MDTETISNTAPRSNVPEMSVSELALALKKTLEDSYGRVRVRGELSRVSIPRSGHMYTDLKDENSVMNAVCWKGVLSKLSIKPEEGLEVICTGRISTFPAKSNYQLIIETMELAGEGALLKMLEERKKKLAAEGLFAPERKKKIPYLPRVIGVVTSPTGAVIRDIMHRLNERFPRHVLVWPVLVQGDGAAQQVAQAVRGFDAMEQGGKVPRPDLLIVARGGGSLEDLMAFNEEEVVRAVAECSIPVITAVGHETDTTLVDYASDLRAPTPTGAAEKAVPVRAELMAWVMEQQKRLFNAQNRLLNEKRTSVQSLSARLGDPKRALENKAQSLDHISHKMTASFERGIAVRMNILTKLGAKLVHPRDRLAEASRMLEIRTKALHRGYEYLIGKKQEQLTLSAKMLNVLSYQNVLARGYVVVKDENGKLVSGADATYEGQNVQLEFKDKQTVDATIGKNAAPPYTKPKKPAAKTTKAGDNQGDLF